MSNDPNNAVFVAHGLTKVYRRGEVEVQALRGIDLTLNRGELVVLLGPASGGEDTGVRPNELLLIGLAGFTGMDVISILR